MTFLVQSKLAFGREIPAQDFGYTFFSAVEFENWFRGREQHQVRLCRDTKFKIDERTRNCVPIGSVEFCLAWYWQMGCTRIAPLNIPNCLWPLVNRRIFVSKHLSPDGKEYYGKDLDCIKAPWNNWYREYHSDTDPMLFTEKVPNVVSEWRLFVFDGKIVDMRCYSGDFWKSPCANYCERAVSIYSNANDAYTLDVLVTKQGSTDILELHDFFACGLYGCDNYSSILRMAMKTQKRILSTPKNHEVSQPNLLN